MQKIPEMEAAGCNVQVAVRCRPANTQEKALGLPLCVATETADRKVNVGCGTGSKKTTKTFNFDRVFGMYSTQEEVFDQMVSCLLSYMNCSWRYFVIRIHLTVLFLLFFEYLHT